MAKFKPIEVLKTLSGKVCGHSDMYFANRGQSRYTGSAAVQLPAGEAGPNLQFSISFNFSAGDGIGLAATENEDLTVTEYLTNRPFAPLNGKLVNVLRRTKDGI